jgi:drug/metabolite transporter (DMT)-like permease
VLPIAATAPLLAMPIAYWLEDDRPGKRTILGGLVAVAGCVALARAR